MQRMGLSPNETPASISEELLTLFNTTESSSMAGGGRHTEPTDVMSTIHHMSPFDDTASKTNSTSIPEDVKQQDIDALLAKEMNAMSLKERERTYEEIHGVDRIPEESTPLLHEKLLDLERALQQIPHKPAYVLALQQNASYIQNAKFRLMFLRSTLFDPVAAAQRLVDFLQGKLDLFGPHTLTRSLYLTDLNKDDMACLKSGAYQLLPARDSTGRVAIVDFHLIVENCYKHPRNLLRTVAFLQLAAAEDEETQKRGMVGIVYYVGNFTGHFNHRLNQQVAEMSKWFPLRLTGFHLCFDDQRLQTWKPLAMLLMGKQLRIRARFHHGTNTEVRYSLMTFGIPVDILPITYQGELKTANHTKWLARRKYKEEQLQKVGFFHGIDLPARNDVILRRGRVFQEHPGNVKMRHLILTIQEEYGQAAPRDKTQIANRVVQQVKDGGGRFLERDQADGWWITVNDKEACKRVSKAIRSMRSTLVAKQQQQLQHETAVASSTVFVQTEDRGKRTRLPDNPDTSRDCR